MEEIDMILKFGWIGWRGDLNDIDSFIYWLYREFGFVIERRRGGSLSLIFQNRVVCNYHGIYGEKGIINEILPDVLLFWKCEDGELEGPSIENYEEPNTDWT